MQTINIPAPKGYTGVDDLPKQRELLINLFSVDDGIVRAPGIDEVIAAAGDGCRGADTWFLDEKAYFVLGTTLYRLESNETLTNLGTIAGTDDVVFSGGQVELVIVVKGGSGYTYDSVNGLRLITSPNYVASDSVTFVDGRHVFVPSDGSQAFWTELDDARTTEATYIFTAEELPDKNVHAINLKNLLVIFGRESIEFFRPVDSTTLPYARMGNTRIDTGYVSGGSKYRAAYVFIGRDSKQSYAIYAMQGQSQPIQISNAAVTEDLNDYTQAQIEAARVNRFKWLDKEFVAWTIADKTYCYVDGNWIFLDSELSGNNTGAWRVNGIAFAYGRYYVGDTSTNNIGKLTDSPSEYGSDVEFQIDTFIRATRGADMRPKGIEVDVLTGQTASTLGLRLSKDGRIKEDYLYRSLGVTGDYRRRVRWRPPGGVGNYESFIGISLRGTGQTRFGLEAIYAY